MYLSITPNPLSYTKLRHQDPELTANKQKRSRANTLSPLHRVDSGKPDLHKLHIQPQHTREVTHKKPRIFNIFMSTFFFKDLVFFVFFRIPVPFQEISALPTHLHIHFHKKPGVIISIPSHPQPPKTRLSNWDNTLFQTPAKHPKLQHINWHH